MSRLERFTGPRARVAAVGIAVATVGAACAPTFRTVLEGALPCAPGPIAGVADGDTAVIENPNQITISGDFFDDKKAAIICFPTGEPVVFEPTPKPEVTPTPESTPTLEPIPEPTLKPITSIIKVKHPAVKITTVKRDIERLYEENPKAQSIYPYALSNLTTCKTGDNDPNPKLALYNRQDTCNRLVANLFKVYKQTGDPKAYKAALDAYNYSISENGLGSSYKKMLDEYLTSLGL